MRDWDAALGLGITEVVRQATIPEMDMDLLSEIIGREFTARLGRAIAANAGLTFDLRFRGMEVTGVRPIRVLRMTASGSDVASIYSWLVARIPADRLEKPAAAETFGQWDWGGNLDSVVRLSFPGEGKGVSAYWSIFRAMSHDAFIAKAAVMAMRDMDPSGRFGAIARH